MNKRVAELIDDFARIIHRQKFPAGTWDEVIIKEPWLELARDYFKRRPDLALIDRAICSSLKWIGQHAKTDMSCSYWDCSRGIKEGESYYFQDFDSELDGQEIYCTKCASFFMSQRLSGIIPLAELKESDD